MKVLDLPPEEFNNNLTQLLTYIQIQIQAVGDKLAESQAIINGITACLTKVAVKTDVETWKLPYTASKDPVVWEECQTSIETTVTSKADQTGSLLKLPARQFEILTLVSRGFTYKEIADKLYITERTVKYHMKEILTKLQLKTRNQAIALIRELEFAKTEESYNCERNG